MGQGHKSYKTIYIENPTNPDPSNWDLLDNWEIGPYLVIKLKYPNCTNYEGIKILVFKSTLIDLVKQKDIDPHFGEKKDTIYPIARFKPDKDGWINAKKFAEAAYEEKPSWYPF